MRAKDARRIRQGIVAAHKDWNYNRLGEEAVLVRSIEFFKDDLESASYLRTYSNLALKELDGIQRFRNEQREDRG